MEETKAVHKRNPETLNVRSAKARKKEDMMNALEQRFDEISTHNENADAGTIWEQLKTAITVSQSKKLKKAGFASKIRKQMIPKILNMMKESRLLTCDTAKYKI